LIFLGVLGVSAVETSSAASLQWLQSDKGEELSGVELRLA